MFPSFLSYTSRKLWGVGWGGWWWRAEREREQEKAYETNTEREKESNKHSERKRGGGRDRACKSARKRKSVTEERERRGGGAETKLERNSNQIQRPVNRYTGMLQDDERKASERERARFPLSPKRQLSTIDQGHNYSRHRPAVLSRALEHGFCVAAIAQWTQYFTAGELVQGLLNRCGRICPVTTLCDMHSRDEKKKKSMYSQSLMSIQLFFFKVNHSNYVVHFQVRKDRRVLRYFLFFLFCFCFYLLLCCTSRYSFGPSDVKDRAV